MIEKVFDIILKKRNKHQLKEMEDLYMEILLSVECMKGGLPGGFTNEDGYYYEYVVRSADNCIRRYNEGACTAELAIMRLKDLLERINYDYTQRVRPGRSVQHWNNTGGC